MSETKNAAPLSPVEVAATPTIPGLATGGLLVISISSLLLVLVWNQLAGQIPASCDELLRVALPGGTCASAMGKLMPLAWALALLPLIMLVERWQPADPTQPLFSPGLFVDALWFFSFPLLGVWLPNAFQQVLAWTGGETVANARLEALTSLPLALQLLFVIVAADFLAWLSHYIRHKIPMFWEFHKIHHSQTELNFFTAKRLHPFDLLANSLIRFLPWTLLGLNIALPGYLIWTTLVRVYESFVHSNIRLNLGPLRYLLVTPQSHRIHHSIEPEHVDRNFGDFFSIWDFMFGTQVREYDIYPKIGVHDAACPMGRATTWSGSIRMFFSELAYPLRTLKFPRQPKRSIGNDRVDDIAA
jgi:sterol desaturase/sphingolipid hydroxylase (fatty acid hydroxylase superfamily)